MSNSYDSRWKTIRKLGSGGQGEVFLVHDRSRNKQDEAITTLPTLVRELTATQTDTARLQTSSRFVDTLLALINAEKADYAGALKVLHRPNAGDVLEKDALRIAREIEAMRSLSHPNLLQLIDAAPEEHWFVSQYHPQGTLDQNLDKYRGSAAAAVRKFRPLVEAVASLHEKGLVHRDIKPKNIFISDHDDLILGDFGIVFFADPEHTRISEDLDQVGSRDWMPPWALHGKLDDVKATFDVFTLGKVLWAMISGQSRLPLWYFRKDPFNLEMLFPDDPLMAMVNMLLAKCVVEEQKDCLESAKELLQETDRLMVALEYGTEPIGDGLKRACKVCGEGKYSLRDSSDRTWLHNFGLAPTGYSTFKVCICDYCGHVQLFFCEHDTIPSAWEPPDKH